MADVGKERTGMLDAPVAHSDPRNRNASLGAMASLTDGKTAKVLVTPITNGVLGIKKAVSLRKRRANRDDPNLMATGSVMRIATISLMQMTINNPHATENGVVIDMARTVTGTAAPNSSRSRNGSTAMTETSHDEHIRRRTLSVGRRG